MDINSVDLMDLEDLEVLETYQRHNIPRTRVNPFELDDKAFSSRYRFSKRFATKIVELLRENLDYDPRGQALSPDLQVLCALRNWARHEVSLYLSSIIIYIAMNVKISQSLECLPTEICFIFWIQDDTADLHGVSQPVISKTCKKIAGLLAGISYRYIKMPVTLNDQERTMRKFGSIANFPRVIGAIDCTHIRVKKIRADGGQLYINRKGYPSINVQVVCDADLKIMDIVTRWRGSVHDSRIFRECCLKQRFESGAFSGLILGDSGYPCTPYLFTPLLNPQTEAEQRYNRSHIRTRNCVERCFGIWKQRFRCLLRGMYGDIETARKTIVACAVLHNIAIDMREDLFPGEVLDDPLINQNVPVVQPYVTNTVRGNIRRREFIETHFM